MVCFMTATPKMTPEQALAAAKEIVGSQGKLARLLGISPSAISRWDQCPIERVLAIEAATSGQITREQLRPDIYPPAR